MRRRALAAGLALSLCAHSAAADGATQALASLGALANFGLCLFLSAQVDEVDEAADEAAGEAADAAKARAAAGKPDAPDARAAEPAAAQIYARRGLVAGLGATTGIEFFDGDQARGEETSFGVAARAGVRCTERMSSELAWEWQEGFAAGNDSDDALWTLTSNAKLHLLTGRVQPFLLAGIGILHGDIPGYQPRTDVAGRLGGGVDFYLTEEIAISLDASYVAPTGNVQKLDYVSVGWGLQVHF